MIQLPKIGDAWNGGTYCGLISQPDSKVVAVVLLPEKPSQRLNWADAKVWAESIGGQLPSRLGAALLYANAKGHFERTWHWTNVRLDADTGDARDASCAWFCDFGNGTQFYDLTSARGATCAVRLIHIEG